MHSITLKYAVLAVVLILTTTAVQIGAQHRLNADIGVDLERYNFSNEVKIVTQTTDGGGDTVVTVTLENHNIKRSLSGHFLGMSLSGPVVNSNFANYALRGRLLGNYYSTNTNTGEVSMYLSPRLNEFSAQVGLFPERRYPIQLFMAQSENYQIRYEEENRNEIEIITPGLAVVRSYLVNRDSFGGQTQITASDKVTLSARTAKNVDKNLRNYDFDENSDIWVDITRSVVNPLREIHNARIINSLPDDSVRVLIGDNINRVDIIIMPLDTVVVVVDSGMQTVEFMPLTKYNHYAFRTRIESDISLNILFKEPAGQADREMSGSTTTLGLKVNGGEKYTEEITVNISSQDQPLTDLTSSIMLISNSADVNLTKNSRLSLATSYNDISSQTGDFSPQSAKALSHSTTYGHGAADAFNYEMSHSYLKNTSLADGLEFGNSMNSFQGKLSRPSDRLDHDLDFKNDYTILVDARKVKTTRLSSEVENSIELFLAGTDITPSNTTKYTITNISDPTIDTIIHIDEFGDTTRTENVDPDVKTREFENRFSLMARIPKLSIFGKVDFLGKMEYRRRSDDVGTKTQTKYDISIKASRSLMVGLNATATMSHRWEIFGETVKDQAEKVDSASLVNPTVVIPTKTEHRSRYTISMTASMIPDVILGGNFGYTPTVTSTNTDYGFSLRAKLPWLKIPLKHKSTKTVRSIPIIDRETEIKIGETNMADIKMETIISYKFRQITFEFEHLYLKEEVSAGTYSLHQVIGKITRGFSVF